MAQCPAAALWRSTSRVSTTRGATCRQGDRRPWYIQMPFRPSNLALELITIGHNLRAAGSETSKTLREEGKEQRSGVVVLVGDELRARAPAKSGMFMYPSTPATLLCQNRLECL